ncbi:nucleoside-diphosphate sugar epimerase/dehydratase [Nitratifractor sp.]|uniref:polysaccharide biosynthesis protein n=1 Tax=Nitratifractor sp. TaxID=2268144 RepID=UPI0025EA6053|nr:nucleoside-diphosphate sugar epimerase/dehydratase [Nitratifractor sp.]
MIAFRTWFKPTTRKRLFFFLTADILLSMFSLYTAYLLRFNFHIPAKYLEHFWLICGVLTTLKVSAMAWKGQYQIVWRFFGLGDMRRVLEAHMVAYGVFALVLYLFRSDFAPFARSIFIIDFFLSFLLLGGLRMAKRLLTESTLPEGFKPTLIVGAGSDAALLRAVTLAEPSYKPEAIVTWNEQGLAGSRIENLQIYPPERLEPLIRERKIHTVIVAEEMTPRELNGLIDRLEDLGVREIKRLRLLEEEREHLEEIPIEELLARDPKDLDREAIGSFLRGKSILVTGAGGSIGSEICRQCLAFGARRLILVENSEYNLYRLLEQIGSEKTAARLVSVLDRERLERVFEAERPQIVIHASAFKHVPLCETNPDTAVENNIIGAMNVMDLGIRYGAEKVVNISSDKAVRPTNVMGATKRITELYAQNVPSGKTEIVSVRFGNVLGSSGSVVPKFKAQIEAGGPVTVTHPEITRYFMLIPEACQLVLQAAAIAQGGELFILDMGEPVKIVDLAKKMIRLYGKEGEVEIVYTGLRPGEKLYEELLIDEAECKTRYESIYVAGSTDYPIEKLRGDIEALLAAEDPRAMLRRIVPEYLPSDCD